MIIILFSNAALRNPHKLQRPNVIRSQRLNKSKIKIQLRPVALKVKDSACKKRKMTIVDIAKELVTIMAYIFLHCRRRPHRHSQHHHHYHHYRVAMAVASGFVTSIAAAAAITVTSI